MKKPKLLIKKFSLLIPYYLLTGLTFIDKNSKGLKNKRILIGTSIVGITAMLSACNSGYEDETCYIVVADSTYFEDTVPNNVPDSVAKVDTIVKNDSIEHIIKCYVPPDYFEEPNKTE